MFFDDYLRSFVIISMRDDFTKAMRRHSGETDLTGTWFHLDVLTMIHEQVVNDFFNYCETILSMEG